LTPPNRATDRAIELTVLMPCLDEAETVAVCVQKAVRYLEETGVIGEVLVVDNGSTDDSVALARAAGARIVRCEARGYGAALSLGIHEACGEYIVMGDADDSYDFSQLAPFLAALRSGDELVMGDRFQGGIMPGAMPALHRYLGNPVLSALGRLLFRSKIRDFHCGLRGFRRDRMIELDLRSPGMEFASEMIVKATLRGLRISEVPTVLHRDGRSRAPHLRTWRDGWRHLRFLLLLSPRWLFLYPGLVLLCVGLLVGIRLTFGSLEVFGAVLDIHTQLIALAMAVVGFQGVWFAILARTFATQRGLLPASARFERWRGRFSLEWTLVAAVAAFLGGIGVLGGATSAWAAVGWGPLELGPLLRVMIPGIGLMVLGAQTLLSGMLLAFLSQEE
jgi:glycosyltransferase involved in cell wall biosynthesis